jgi:hypothetical protein
MPSKRAPKRAGAIPSTRGQRADGKGLDPQVPGYVVTRPRGVVVNGLDCCDLDGSLLADAGLAARNGRAL